MNKVCQTSNPEKVMNFFQQALTNDFIAIKTFTAGREVRVNCLSLQEDGSYTAKYSWSGWPQAMYGSLPTGQQFTITKFW
jgi:hypothetical protein